MTAFDTLTLLIAVVALAAALLQASWNRHQDEVLDRHTLRLIELEIGCGSDPRRRL